MRILIAEDDAILSEGLCRSLRQAGYSVDCVKDGEAADTALSTSEFDLLVLDIGLPRLNGFEVLRRLRARNNALPVLILTALDGVNDRVRGLDLGADDYLAKPFALAELEARVRALTRRGHNSSNATLKHGDLTYDTVGKVAEIRGQMLDLSARELALLEIFLQRPGRMVSKEQIGLHPPAAQEARVRRREDRDRARPGLLPREGAWQPRNSIGRTRSSGRSSTGRSPRC